jgi:hypothetical protein
MIEMFRISTYKYFILQYSIVWIVEKSVQMAVDAFNVHLVIIFVHVLIHIVVFDVNLNDHHVVVC